jgi:hypothetical protein
MIGGMGGGGTGAGYQQQAGMAAAKRDSDTANTLSAVNQVGATALTFIPYVGPLLSALASGIGAAANAKAQEDAKKKMQAAQEGPVGGNSATGVIQAPQIGMAPNQSNPPDQMGSFLSSLGQTRQSGGFA